MSPAGIASTDPTGAASPFDSDTITVVAVAA